MRYKQTLRDFIAPEIASWPGVSYTVDKNRNHLHIVLHYENRSRFLVASKTGSDRRGHLNLLTNMRRELSVLGAKREGL